LRSIPQQTPLFEVYDMGVHFCWWCGWTSFLPWSIKNYRGNFTVQKRNRM